MLTSSRVCASVCDGISASRLQTPGGYRTFFWSAIQPVAGSREPIGYRSAPPQHRLGSVSTGQRLRSPRRRAGFVFRPRSSRSCSRWASRHGRVWRNHLSAVRVPGTTELRRCQETSHGRGKSCVSGPGRRKRSGCPDQSEHRARFRTSLPFLDL